MTQSVIAFTRPEHCYNHILDNTYLVIKAHLHRHCPSSRAWVLVRAPYQVVFPLYQTSIDKYVIVFLDSSIPNVVKSVLKYLFVDQSEWSRLGKSVFSFKVSNHDEILDDVMKWKHFPHYWPFVRGIHRSPVNSPHKGQWCGAFTFSLIGVWINGWVNSH